MSAPVRHLILGDGAAGIAAALVIRTARPADRIVIVSDDPQPAYYRAALTNYLSGQLSDSELWALPPDAWDRLRLERVVGSAARLDAVTRTVTLSDARELPYDRLLIATGAHASSLPAAVTGIVDPVTATKRHIRTLRTLKDTKDLIERASRARRVVILGGGILGIEAAHGLLKRNLQVTLVHRGAWLMERLVDRRASALIEMQMIDDGVVLKLGCDTRSIEPTPQGERVTLADGEVLDADFVVTCIGITPNTHFAAAAGLALDRGFVVVDGHMRASGAENVFAAGDVALVRDPAVPNVNPGGLWQPARKQGQVAGLNMVDATGARHAYRPGYVQNATKAWHLDLVTAGVHVDSGTEALRAHEARRDGAAIYKRVAVEGDHLKGFMLLGDRREATALCRLMNLRGAAGSIESIKGRLFDPGFDLFSWVAAQERQPNTSRLKETIQIPLGAIPPSLAASTPIRSQRSLAAVENDALKSAAARSVAAPSANGALSLAFDNQIRRFDNGPVRVIGEAVDGLDIAVQDIAAHGGHLELSAAGAGWLASPVGDRLPATRNGLPLNRPVFLCDCDVLQVGAWKAVVGLERTKAALPSPETQYELLGHSRHRLRSGVTMIGRSRDNDVVLDDPGVSFFHAQITLTDAGYYLVDAGSATGTRVNREPLTVSRRLSEGDMIEFGLLTLVFQAAKAPATPQTVAAVVPEGAPDCYLACVEGPMAPRALPLRLPATIGRGESADAAIDDPLLSRMHARISQDGGRFLIADLGSVNGIQVDGEKLRGGIEHRLTTGAQVRLGAHLFRFELQQPSTFLVKSWRKASTVPQQSVGTQVWTLPGSQRQATARGYELQPIDDLLGPERKALLLNGPGPHVFGRKQTEDIIAVPLKVISERHAEIHFVNGRYELRDLQSSNGTFLNGRRLGEEAASLADGDEIRLHVLRLRFRALAFGAELPAPEAEQRLASPARFDNWDEQRNPLESDLSKVVHEELDACIGCHMCMRACPLPQAQTVTIAALNGLAAGIVQASPIATEFVDACTQCHACVPVCPVNIRRSRIVLWNKLKAAPDPDAPVSVQVSDGQANLGINRAEIAAELAKFPFFEALNEVERLRCVAQSRVRQLIGGERLIGEGLYIDALWVLLRGQLESGARTPNAEFQRMVLLGPGQTAGERAVLSDASSEVTVRATTDSLVIGIPKYTLRSLGDLNRRFQTTLDSLYLARTTEAVLRASERFRGLPDADIRRLAGQMRAERYVAGQVVFAAVAARRSVGVVVRGFVKQIHRRQEQEVVSNYLKSGDVFGVDTAAREDPLLRFEAATLAEVLTIDADALARLLPPASNGAQRPMQTTAHANDSVMQAHRLMVIDTRLCVDCDNCVDACERRHGHSRIDRGGSSKQVGPFQIPGSCYHCEDPVCLLCAVDGIVREPSGEIRIIEDNCIGCGACAERCPYDNIRMTSAEPPKTSGLAKLLPLSWRRLLEGVRDEAPGKAAGRKIASKCDLCAGYADGPACVRSCPTGAAQRIDPGAFFKPGGCS